ncbi:glucosaminidase domain-containing protein [Marinobacter sp. M1N3S26]|uniref:glucosaminidase domain-containing protein n=1 Tax=Marinobacter sp. M1N3S26 TaxID=3382299 RepID=UPI00387B5905
MSAGSRSLLLIIPFTLAALWGVLHTPPPPPEPRTDDAEEDVELATLPELPRWILDPLPDFHLYQDVTEKKAAFFSYLYSRTLLVNSRILLQRQHLLDLQVKETLSENDIEWLAKQAERLRVDQETGSDEMFRRLLRRLDTIPPSLVLAQAANESAWGTSRFARQGNNLFGQWCFSPGCGLVPLSRPEGANYEVARFRSAYHSVRAYVQNLNRHPAYHELRVLREKAHQSGGYPTGSELAAGLGDYSERGHEYIRELRSMIRYNNLVWYDQQYRDTIVSRDNIEGLMDLATAPEERLQPGYEPAEDTNTASVD